MKSLFRLLLVLCLPVSFLHADALQRGSMSVGGHARVSLKWDAFGNLASDLEAIPSFSYFFAKRFELTGGLRVEGRFFQDENVRAERSPMRYGFQVGVNHYFDFGLGFFPYLGLTAGADIADFKLVSTKLFVEIPIGIAFILGEDVMLQIGAPFRVSFEPPGATLGTVHPEWTPGYIGVRVFF